jgi:hypothetical protein
MPRNSPAPKRRAAAPAAEWEVLHMGKRARRLGIVRAANEAEALEKAVAEFGIRPADRTRTLIRRHA